MSRKIKIVIAYLEEAVEIVETTLGKKLDDPILPNISLLVIEIAKMIQLEDHNKPFVIHQVDLDEVSKEAQV